MASKLSIYWTYGDSLFGVIWVLNIHGSSFLPSGDDYTSRTIWIMLSFRVETDSTWALDFSVLCSESFSLSSIIWSMGYFVITTEFLSYTAKRSSVILGDKKGIELYKMSRVIFISSACRSFKSLIMSFLCWIVYSQAKF